MEKFLLLLLLLPLSLLGQTFPVDAQTGKITYTEEVLVMDAAQTELFDRAKSWINSTNKKEKTQLEEDFRNGIITGRTCRTVVLSGGKGKVTYDLWYTVIFRVENDRYWYRLTDFRLQPLHSSHPTASNEPQARKRPLEAFGLPVKTPGTNKENKAFVAQIENSLQALLEDMKAHLLGSG